MLSLTVWVVELTKLGPPYAVPVRVSVKAWVRLRLTPGKLARNGEECVGRMKINVRAGQLDLILFGQLIEQPAGATKELIVYQAKTQAILIGGVVQLKTGLDRQFLSDAPGPGRIGRPLVPLCKAQNQAGGPAVHPSRYCHE